ncbi:effector binding domain-containing protein [Tunicatimonas pelagia]|uniref:effector binding domain-containing protein n=1 Tax=Tunicatimonas pelagia TaxID=931531 RepID=UPI0026650FFF|nr:effector binding domain-containing protein [Tunicatimonas pelagia]WKN41116.1 effector binding domain-containing protein [Tunicatimonas pelagia]
MTEDNKPRLARLTTLITQLQAGRIITARAMAQQHGVSIRTIYRDIRTLEQSGIPIVTEEGKGYSLVDGYNLPPVMFSEEEANALITAEQLIARNQDQSLAEQYHRAITKIKSVLKHTQQEKTELLTARLQIRSDRPLEKASHHLMNLQSAITNYQVAALDYKSLSDQRSQRTVEPFALYSTQGNWILVAFCRLRSDFRAFRLDCIQSLHVTNQSFEPHPITLQEYFEQCRKKCLPTPDIPLSSASPNLAENQNHLNMKTVKIEPFQLIGISVRTTNENGQAAQDIGQLWSKFMAENMLSKIPNKVDDTVYSLYTDYEGDHTQPYTTILGCKVNSLDEIPEEMAGRSFDGGNYVKTTAKGDLAQGLIINHWSKIWATELARRYTADFEVYGTKATNPSDAEVDILVAVE